MDSVPTLMRTQKLIKRKKKVNSLVREQYLRDDVKCHSPICTKCSLDIQKGSQVKEMFLSKDIDYYTIPSYEIFQNYLEILEIQEIKGIIILQSIASKVLQASGRGSYRRLLNISRDSRKGCGVFLNEICKSTNVERLPSFSEKEWLAQCVKKAAEYYCDHLENIIPIIVIADDVKMYSDFEKDSNVKVLTFKSYLESKWSDVTDAINLLESISASLALSNIKDSSKVYENYLPQEILNSGIKSGKYFHGILRVNKHISSQEAYVTSSKVISKHCGDILIFGLKDRNRAIHGDEVVAELLPKTEWKSKCGSLVTASDGDKENVDESSSGTQMPTGKVVGVLERKWRAYVATFPIESEESDSTQRSSSERILVVPYDYRIPRIRIATKQGDKLRNQRIIVRIDYWDKDSQYPNGHFVRQLGEVGLLETEVQSLLVEHNVNTSKFPQGLSPELPFCSLETPWNIDDDEIQKRRDLRQSHLIFSIDPKGCEDVDDALSVRQLSNGMLELGVHIADVTYFVQPSSLTDLEARSRSTSVYLPDRRYDMLPHILSGNLCSLLGNVNRYAVSVLWILDSNFEVQDVWFGRTIIRSRYKLCYEDVEKIHLGHSAAEMKENIPEFQELKTNELDKRFCELKDAVLKLTNVSYALRAKRLASGGLELDNINMKFEIDKTLPSIIRDFKKVEDLEIHKTVAECMIFANHWVAKKISDYFPQQSVLRRHPHPRETDLVELQQLAGSRGFSFDIHSNKELAKSLQHAVDIKNPAVNQIFRILATRSMNEATYFCTGSVPFEEYYHYGLGISQYTHFTSPIRRYADVLVHRLLLAAIGESDKDDLLKMSELESLCNHINEKHRAAQDVEKCTQELFQVQFFKELASQSESELCLADAVVYSIKANGVLVFLPRYGMKGAVCLYDKEKKVAVIEEDGVQWQSGHLEIKESAITVICSTHSQTHRIFDHLTVRVKVQNSRAHQPKISLELFNNKPYDTCAPENCQNLSKKHLVPGETNFKAAKSSDAHEVVYDKRAIEGENNETKGIYSLLKHFREITLLVAD